MNVYTILLYVVIFERWIYQVLYSFTKKQASRFIITLEKN